MKRAAALLLAILVITSHAFAQAETEEATPSALGFQAGISLGTDVLVGSDGNPETWNSLGFQPDLALGPFGVGLDLTLRFKLMPTAEEAIRVYPGDWIPEEGSGKTYLDLYLPKIMYLRYGLRGEPLFVKLGSIDDLTLGNGFIVGDYANTRFLPTQRVFGLNLGLDGKLFDFPFVGIEFMTGNLARLDVFGTRLYVRPLVTTKLPILEDLQVGGTFAMDSGAAGLGTDAFDNPVIVGGADVFVPIIKSQAFPLAAFTELAFEPKSRTGFMAGLGGRLLGVITYGAQLRLLGAGFVPVYFDANYDLYRSAKASLMSEAPAADAQGFAGWLAKAGASLFEDKLYFSVSVDGPFKAKPAEASPNSAEYPHLRGVVGMAEGILGGFFVTGSYEKYFIGKDADFFSDLVDPSDAVIGAALNYKTGAAVFTLLYSLKYNPDNPKGFDVTSSLQSAIKF